MKRTQYGWYAGWAAVVVVLIALPVILLTTRGTPTVAADGDLPSSAAPSTKTPTLTPTAASSNEPLCSNVWQQGKTLPAAYKACQSGGDEVPAAHLPGQSCILAYDHHYFAAPGGVIHPMTAGWRSSKAYDEAKADCRAR